MNNLADIKTAARLELTPAQYAAWELNTTGLGTRMIAIHLGISRAATIDRLAAAAHRLRKAGIYQDASGNWITTRKDNA